MGKTDGPNPHLVLLWFDLGFDTAAIAEKLGVPEPDVYHALQRAREARRRLYDENCPTIAAKHQSPLEDE